jgi:hypothetical protein
MTSPQSIEKAFEEFMEYSSNPRQQESLRRLHKACDYLQQQNIRITPSETERYCLDHDWAGPKAQSIRNSPVLRRYLALRQSGQVINLNKKKPGAKPLIVDETLRAYVHLLTEERDQAIAERIRVQRGLRSIPGIPVDDLIRQGFGAPESTKQRDTTAPLSPNAKEALGLLFDEQRLADCGLKLHRDRIIHGLTGNILLERKHVEAIRALGQGIAEVSPGQTGNDNSSRPLVGLESK